MPPFIIYIVWHPQFQEGSTYAEFIYRTFNRNFNDPSNRSLGIPVFYRSIGASGSEDEMPRDIDSAAAQRSAVIILVDDQMVIHREPWKDYLDGLMAMDSENGNLRIFPIALTKNASNVNDKVNRKNYIRLFKKETLEDKCSFLAISLAHEFCRLLHGYERVNDNETASLPRLKLFLSHSKADGVAITKLLKCWVQEFTGLQAFFDATDIPPGESFAKVIRENVDVASLLVIQTDVYSTREWCRAEVLEAKKYKRPVVVVDALVKGESRSFPYMNNVPVVRWSTKSAAEDAGQIEHIILIVLLETLRHRYQHEFFDTQWKQTLPSTDRYKMLSNAPELLDLIDEDVQWKDAPASFLYPDPPIGNEELQVLKKIAPLAKFITPVQLISEWTQQEGQQRQFTIGISISESGMMERRGLSQDHLRDAMIEAARYLLASGYALAYGGDLHYAEGFNFVNLIRDMVRTYQSDYKPQKASVTNFVAYPLFKLIEPSVEAEMIEQIKFNRVPPPSTLADVMTTEWQPILKGETVQDQFLFAECLTEMRRQMNGKIDARIILGGKLTGFKGKYPGLVEEAMLAMQSGKPVFLIGAFGGCAEAIIRAIMGEKPLELTEAYQARNERYHQLINYNRQQAIVKKTEEINYEAVTEFFNTKGISGLCNGLSAAENEVLLNSNDVRLIISLLLKGMKTCSK